MKTPSAETTYRIEVKVREIGQLFNSMDPAPFHEKDLDHDAEEYIETWAMEAPRHAPLELVVHLQEPPAGQDASKVLEQAVHNYYAAKAEMNWLEFKRLMKDGRISLVIGLACLSAFLLAGQFLAPHHPPAARNVMQESLTIAGWVAMWRPMEIFLYNWWPILRRNRIFKQLSTMPVQVKSPAGPSA